MTEWTERLSTGYNVQVLTELYFVIPRDRKPLSDTALR
jgi:hypothetical protein